MTDRELLEFAAKAAGLRVVDSSHPVTLYIDTDGCKGGVAWNPLTDDGDALRLVSFLKLHILWASHADFVLVCNDASEAQKVLIKEKVVYDRQAAIRRAIVRAAAKLGDTL